MNRIIAQAKAASEKSTAIRGCQLVQFPTQQAAPVNTTESDLVNQLAIPPEPEPPTELESFAARLGECVEAIMSDPRINFSSGLRQYVRMICALSDGRKRFAASHRTMMRRVPNSEGRSDGAKRSWLKAKRRDLERRQAEIGIRLVEIIPGGIVKRDDGGEDIKRPAEYIPHILNLAGEVLALLTQKALEDASPACLHYDNLSDDEREEDVREANFRASWRTALFQNNAALVLDRHIKRGSVPRPERHQVPDDSKLRRFLKLATTYQRKVMETLVNKDLGLNHPEQLRLLNLMKERYEQLEKRRGYCRIQGRKR